MPAWRGELRVVVGGLPADIYGSGAAVRSYVEAHHNVYAVLLNPDVARHPKVLRQNPNRDPAKPCVYVGMTGLTVAERFTNHRNGYKSSWIVKKYGEGLMPELYEHLNPMPYDAAVQMEKDLAEDLRNQGYTVTGGHRSIDSGSASKR